MAESSKSLSSFVAGATAGGCESFITFPFEFAKTRLQLLQSSPALKARPSNPISLLLQVGRADGLSAIYAGCFPFAIGNTAKAGVRFLSFDFFRDLMRDDQGKLSVGRGAIAGLGAGVMESVFALTPGESVKTALIDDRQGACRYSGQGFRGIRLLIKDHGIGVLYRGVVPVTARQAANSMVRLGSYSTLRAMLENKKGGTLNSAETFALGAVVGIITVYTTMPIDTVKTRMQSVDASTKYTGMIDCFGKVVKNDGVKALWRGSTARLGRLVMSGGIVFTIYEKIMQVLK
uniref:Mitochondrial Ctp1 n=1 Tax=Starmerella bombicola TaxID=75736 RepID=A0A6M8Y3G7_STABO|nr:mitochondrial Ctp1 [Starmerella bombicola]